MVVQLAVQAQDFPGKCWVVHCTDASATAQGETRDEALTNLRELLRRYAEVLDELWADARARGQQVELVPA